MTQPSDREARYSLVWSILDTVYHVFWNAYEQRAKDRKYYDDMPLLIRGWRPVLIEAKRTFIFIELRPYDFDYMNARMWADLQIDRPELANFDDPAEVVKIAKLQGEIIGNRELPFTLGNFVTDDQRDQIITMTTDWAVEQADKDIDNVQPSFDRAADRMVSAYKRLFELEQHLRVFVQQVLEMKYGNAWWDKLPADAQNQITRREADPTATWFDDFSPTRLKFADFDMLRRIALANWADFKSVLGDSDLFHSHMAWLGRARDRIAHVNTLSGNDFQEFMSLSGRLFDMIRPHVRLG